MKHIGVIGIISIFIIAAAMIFGSKTLQVPSEGIEKSNPSSKDLRGLKSAYFAGGCFWCMESIFEKQDGVEGAYVGYTGGKQSTASYEETSNKTTNHREAVRVIYDPSIISYRKIVELFWTQIDPRDDGGQFYDRGFVYSTTIFYSNLDEKAIAEKSKSELESSQRFTEKIVTPIEEAKPFYDAEEYHQDYYKQNPIRYKLYTGGSGRKEFIEENWQDRIEELEGKDYVDGILTKIQ